MAKAITELVAALHASKGDKRVAPNLAQAYLANMGYFVLDTRDLSQAGSVDDARPPNTLGSEGSQNQD